MIQYIYPNEILSQPIILLSKNKGRINGYLVDENYFETVIVYLKFNYKIN